MEDKNFNDYVVTARKWRPMKFAEVVGQEHITKTLKNAVIGERIHHAYLFNGPRGVGKTTTARILARAVNCQHTVDAEPCNVCEFCLSVIDGRSMDVIEIDGASNNSVDDIRKLRENSKYPPIEGKFRMYIIDEVHMLSTSAFNALLKTLEEPPKHLLFVFATTEPHKLPATIISRCQRYDFRMMEIESIVKQLGLIAKSEGIDIEEAALNIIAKKAGGSMRDSESIFDQALAFCGKTVTADDLVSALNLIDASFFFEISLKAREKNIAAMFDFIRQIVSRGYDIQECAQGLIEHYRNLLAVKTTKDITYIDASANYRKKYLEESEFYNPSDLLRILTILNNTEQTLKRSTQPRIKFEYALSQIASMDSIVELGKLINIVENIEKGNLEPVKQFNAIAADNSVRYNPTPQATVQERPTATYERPQTQNSPPPAPTQNVAPKIAGGDKISTLIQEISKTQIAVATMLKNAAKISVHDKDVLFQCSSKLSFESLNKNKETIVDNVRKVFGDEYYPKIFIGDGGLESVEKKNIIDNKPSAGKSAPQTMPNREYLPIEQSLIDNFRAVENFIRK